MCNLKALTIKFIDKVTIFVTKLPALRTKAQGFNLFYSTHSLKSISRPSTIKGTHWAARKKSAHQHKQTLYHGNLILGTCFCFNITCSSWNPIVLKVRIKDKRDLLSVNFLFFVLFCMQQFPISFSGQKNISHTFLYSCLAGRLIQS